MRSIKFILFFLVPLMALFALACSDDDSSNDYPFDREAMEMSVLRTCASESDENTSCYRLVYRYPYDTINLESIYLWLDTKVVDDTSKEVSSSQLKKADSVLEFKANLKREFDTIDLTALVKDYVKEKRDTLQVALFCDYSKGDNGIVQRYILRFRDMQPPSLIALIIDSTWTTGAIINWTRPTDQVDYDMPMNASGPIVGYNIVLSTDNENEDLSKVAYSLENGFGEMIPNVRIRNLHDSIVIDTLSKQKNKLHLSVLDGKGFNTENDSLNRFILSFDGLKAESKYSVNIVSYDSAGNESDPGNYTFWTTDSIAPLISTKLFFKEDTLFKGVKVAALDSNNRLRFFWSRAVDPFLKKHNIEVDSLLKIPVTCSENSCYGSVSFYEIRRYNTITGDWDSIPYVGGISERYEKSYDWEDGKIEAVSVGRMVVDTIRKVSPLDTIILKIRARDVSGFYSSPLIDTIIVSPGILAKELNCPQGYVAVAASDSNKFCMERFEHMDNSGKFINNVLHAEAVATCESISAKGFKISLCKERDWEQVCLSNGALNYGMIEEEDNVSDELFRTCNVGKNDSLSAISLAMRNPNCVNPMGVRDMPGQLQEWVMGRSLDSASVLKGASYKKYNGLEVESFARCTNRSFPYFTRLAYTEDTVYFYREGTKLDTTYEADTSRTLYKKLTKKDFKDSLQFFNVEDSNGNFLGIDYAPYAEYKKGGKEWLDKVSNGLVYKPSKVKVVFFTGETIPYREVAKFYKSPSIGFRCCAYPE